jgi:hypothetical protein
MLADQYILKRIDYISNDVNFCRKHWDWAIIHGKRLFVVESSIGLFSIAISSDSRTISADEPNSIVCYKHPLNYKIGMELIGFLESENILSIYSASRDFHHRLINKLCLSQNVDSSLCTCGAVKAYGNVVLKQKFIHSSWCDILD